MNSGGIARSGTGDISNYGVIFALYHSFKIRYL